MSQGSVLVVLPTLGDRLDFLAETITSVDAQRDQVDLTLVVIAPTAAHEARELARSRGAVVVDDPKQGISTAINLGIDAATDERYYAWIGDDDLFRPGGLARLRSLIEERDDTVVSYGGCDYIDPEGRTIATSNAGRLARWIQPWGPNLIPHPGSLIKLDPMRSVGLFEPDLKYAMDLDLFLKLRRRGRFACTRESVSAFRWHPDSLTVANRAASNAESEAIKRRHLPRAVRPLSVLWNRPIQLASARAARELNRRALALRDTDRHG
jgi:glycosyltransferase involved in cell wall biosynthesis